MGETWLCKSSGRCNRLNISKATITHPCILAQSNAPHHRRWLHSVRFAPALSSTQTSNPELVYIPVQSYRRGACYTVEVTNKREYARRRKEMFISTGKTSLFESKAGAKDLGSRFQSSNTRQYHRIGAKSIILFTNVMLHLCLGTVHKAS